MGARGCTWRVASVERIIQKRCHNRLFFGAVEARGGACFAGCGADARNASSPCWTDCFYKTVRDMNQ